MMRFSIIIIILNESLTQKLESCSNDRAKSSIGKISEELLEDCIYICSNFIETNNPLG